MMMNIFWLQVLISKRMIQDHMPDNVLDALEKVLLIIWKWGKIIHQRRNITHITLFVELCSHIKKKCKIQITEFAL